MLIGIAPKNEHGHDSCIQIGMASNIHQTRADTLPIPAAGELESACARAMEHQVAGRIDLARQLYTGILQAQPAFAAANYGLGMVHVQSRRPAESLPFLLAALQASPEMPDYWLGYLEALTLAGETHEAQRTLALGRQHGLAGAAVEDFARRLEAKLTSEAQAEPLVEPQSAAPPPLDRAAPERPPTARDAIMARGSGRPNRRIEGPSVRKQESALLEMVKKRNFEAALSLAREMVERFPERGLAWKVLGALLPTADGFDQALAALQTAARLLPRDAEAHVNLGFTLAKAQHFDEAEFHLKRALELDPEFATAHYRLAAAYELQGRYADAEASLRRGFALRADYVAGDDQLSHSHLLFLMSHNPSIGADELFAEHRRYGAYFENRLQRSSPRHRNDRDPRRCLKIGIVSGDLFSHAVASFIEPILTLLVGRPDLELHAYYSNAKHDDVSARLMRNFKTWNVVCELTDHELANAITKDRIDILIDLSGHTGLNRLPAFARKPAPIQASWIGYPGTTGLRAMDYFLADPHFLPPGEFDRYFTEKLVYLPAQAAFQPHEAAPPISSLPALATGRVTFGSFNRLGKINEATINLWSQLLRELPESRMLLAGIAPGADHGKLIAQFAAAGIGAGRLAIHERCGMDSYLALYHQVDLCLDTYPYNGGTTNIHGVWMGVPTLTIAGSTPAARPGAAILSQVGLEGFTAANATEFVAQGVHWASHLDALAEVRQGLRRRLQESPSRRADIIALALAAALRRMWRRWCAGLPAESFHSTASDLAG